MVSLDEPHGKNRKILPSDHLYPFKLWMVPLFGSCQELLITYSITNIDAEKVMEKLSSVVRILAVTSYILIVYETTPSLQSSSYLDRQGEFYKIRLFVCVNGTETTNPMDWSLLFTVVVSGIKVVVNFLLQTGVMFIWINQKIPRRHRQRTVEQPPNILLQSKLLAIFKSSLDCTIPGING